MRADGRLLKVDAFQKLDRYKEHDIEVVVADLKAPPACGRPAVSPNPPLCKEALRLGQGTLLSLWPGGRPGRSCLVFDDPHRCGDGGILSRARSQAVFLQFAPRVVPRLPGTRAHLRLDAGARRGRGRSRRRLARLRYRSHGGHVREQRAALPGMRRGAPQPHRPRGQVAAPRGAARFACRNSCGKPRPSFGAAWSASKWTPRGRLILAGYPPADRGAPEVSRPGRPRLPRARPRNGNPLRRRIPAHPSGGAAWLRSFRRPLCPGRAQHRLARRRQSPADRDSPCPPRQGQHPPGGRTRRRGHGPAADRIIDLGPGAGGHGGEVLANGTPAEIKRSARSLTGLFLNRGNQASLAGAATGRCRCRTATGSKLRRARASATCAASTCACRSAG